VDQTGVNLLIEPSGGLAGDMLLAALLDLGDAFVLGDLEALARELVPGECTLDLREVERGGFRALALEVHTAESHHAPHRHLPELLELLGRGSLPDAARARAARVLERLARAEAAVHGLPVEEVHFHEVGAVDTLIDVAGAALALERLGVRRVLSTTPYVGGGTVRCAHGELPVPAPGTAELLRGLPHRRGTGGERLTPTGAALLAELVEVFEPEEGLVVRSTGYGAGQRDPADGPPNLVRVSLCESSGAVAARTEAWQLECNLDDATGEELGFVVGALREAGALDAWTVPVHMKKGRPGTLVQALCRSGLRAELERVLFAHSPTLGLRWVRCERTELERAELTVELPAGRVRVKRRLRPGIAVAAEDLSPEHDDLARLSRETGQGLRALERAAVEAALRQLGSS